MHITIKIWSILVIILIIYHLCSPLPLVSMICIFGCSHQQHHFITITKTQMCAKLQHLPLLVADSSPHNQPHTGIALGFKCISHCGQLTHKFISHTYVVFCCFHIYLGRAKGRRTSEKGTMFQFSTNTVLFHICFYNHAKQPL